MSGNVRCGKCSALNLPDAVYCSLCGAALAETGGERSSVPAAASPRGLTPTAPIREPRAEAPTVTPPGVPARQCPECGYVLNPPGSECPWCAASAGQPVHRDTTPHAVEPEAASPQAMPPRPRLVPPRRVAPVSKAFWIGSQVVPAAVFGVAYTVLSSLHLSSDVMAALAFPLVLLLLCPGVVFLFFISRIWESVQDQHAWTSPGRAFGFLFIPFFNLYWLVEVLRRFPDGYRAFLNRYELEGPRLNAGLFLALPVLMLSTFALRLLVVALHLAPTEVQLVLVILWLSAALACLGVLFAVIADACDAINALARATWRVGHDVGVK